MRKYDDAIVYLQRALELEPNFALARAMLAEVYVEMKLYDKAFAEAQKAVRLSNGNLEKAVLGRSYFFVGKKSEAMQILENLLNQSKLKGLATYEIARVYAAFTDKGKTFEWLNNAYEERTAYFPHLVVVDPALDFIRSDDRFVEILSKMGLEP
jgi:tetratricopeptide (TPR) repeat protein